MKTCPRCGSEYEDSVERCTDCAEAPVLVAGAKPTRSRGISHNDERTFVKVGEAEDPLTVEDLADALEAAGIAVMVQEHQSSSVDLITSGGNHPWWELSVPDTDAGRATKIVETEELRIESEEAEAEKAAEEESGAA